MQKKLLIFGFLFFLACHSNLLGQHFITLKSGLSIEGTLDTTNFNGDAIQYFKAGAKEKSSMSKKFILYVTNYLGEIIYPRTFIGNTESKIFHLATVSHLPEEKYRENLLTIENAFRKGYKPCNSCFDNRPMISDYYLERRLFNASKMVFQNQNEIVYEHPQLEYLQKMVDTVLATWIEPLKGYTYRALIFKSDDINASAIAGGSLFFSTELLLSIENPDELKAVIAHEIAHVERRHTLREYYLQQRKKNNDALALMMITGMSAIGGNADWTKLTFEFTKSIMGASEQLVLNGFSRELEQEADIVAQLYFQKISLDKKQIVSILDKMSTHSLVRDFSISTNAYSSHPNLMNRIQQVSVGQITIFNEPRSYSVEYQDNITNTKEKLFINIKYLYRTVSSTNPSENVVFIIGNALNPSTRYNLSMSELGFMVEGMDKNITTYGLSQVLFHKQSRNEFCIGLNVQSSIAAKIVEQFKNSNIEFSEVSLNSEYPNKDQFKQAISTTSSIVPIK